MKIKTQIFENIEPLPNINDIICVLEKNQHHLKNVLRIKNGEIIKIIINEEFEAIGKIVETEKALSYKIMDINKISNKTNLNITICFAICKSGQNELVAEKLTELGVKNIYFWVSKHTSYKVAKFSDKLERLEKIIEGASRQSKQTFIPRCKIYNSLNELLRIIDIRNDIALYCSLASKRQKIKDLRFNKDIKNIYIFIGPEGDFSKDEYEALGKMQNAIPITLGDSILKSETAAIVATSQLIGMLL
ncbi:MAG: RsmE family RNA methyltransferase [Bdellovibrionota bacterium]